MIIKLSEKSCDHTTIGCGTIFRLRNDKGWNTVKFVEYIGLNSMNYHFLHDYCGNTSINVSERSKSAWFLVISSIILQIILFLFFLFSMSCFAHFCGNFWKSKFWARKDSNFLKVCENIVSNTILNKKHIWWK